MPAGSDLTPAQATSRTTAPDPPLLPVRPGPIPDRPRPEAADRGRLRPVPSCRSLLAEYEPQSGAPNKYAKDTQCLQELEALGPGGPPAGSTVFAVPRGINVVEGEPAPNQSARVHRFFVIEDDSELNGKEIKNPEQAFDPNTHEPLVNMEFTDKGRQAFAAVTKRIADRGRNCETLAASTRTPAGHQPSDFFQRFAITLDNKIVSLATIDYQENPDGIDGRNGASIQDIGSIQDAQDLAESLRIGALPIDLKLISQTQVSATLGQQALHQGLTAAAVGLALTILFLLIFYRVLGVVATAALLVYAVLLFALIKLIPITLTLPGIAGNGAHARGGGRRQHRDVRANKGGGAGRAVDPGRDLGRVHEGAPGDHRRERRDDRRRVHPVHARDGGRARVRVHAGGRHARLAVHGRARHLGDPRRRWRARGCCGAERARRAHRAATARAGASTSWATRAGSSRSRA